MAPARKGRESDGRNIDPEMGSLSGEGSAQRGAASHPVVPVYGETPSEQTEDTTYYDRPVIKKSPWTWDVPAYYYTGGTAGAAVAFGAFAHLLEPRGLRQIVVLSRWIGVAGSVLSTYFLIHDLGRPSRFLYMLRVFRITSPMSVGVYILSAFASANGLAWLTSYGPRSLRGIAGPATFTAGVFGIGMAGYTGVLIANTVVPLWYVPRRIMPLLFLASGGTAAASLFECADLTGASSRAVGRFGLVSKAAELVAIHALEHEVMKTPQVGRALRSGVGALLWHVGKGLVLASALLSLVPRKSRRVRIASGIVGTAAAVCVRFGIHYAGHRSADDPKATFHLQNAKLKRMKETDAVTPR